MKQELNETKPRLELWWHPIRCERYAVLVTASGVQLACGPLGDRDLRAIQQDERAIRWNARLGERIDGRAGEFVVAWPPAAPPIPTCGPTLTRQAVLTFVRARERA